ncbi:MAG: alpha/beta hydrolase [Ginsengibacter sp.]
MKSTTNAAPHAATTQTDARKNDADKVRYKTIKIEGQHIFYREAGPVNKPSILLLHGFPSSSHMFRNVIALLGNKYHLVAPDYPGFGNSSMPSVKEFEYSFDHLAHIIDLFVTAIHLKKYSLYMMDYGAPVGFRIACKHPEKVQALLIQNGNAYVEGLSPFWDNMKAYWAEPQKESNINFIKSLLTLEGTQSQYLDGVQDVTSISPDNWIVDQRGLDRPGNQDIQMELFYSYRTNPPLYPLWQEYMRKNQPPALITWGKNDGIFPESGAHPFKRDLKNVEMHILDTGHFALEEEGELICTLIDRFLAKNNIN